MSIRLTDEQYKSIMNYIEEFAEVEPYDPANHYKYGIYTDEQYYKNIIKQRDSYTIKK